MVKGSIAFDVADKDLIAVTGTLVHLYAGTMRWFRLGNDGGEMTSMTLRQVASLISTNADRAISQAQNDIRKLVEVADQRQLTVAPKPV